MGAGSYERKEFVGGAPATSLVASLTDVATTFDLDDATGWPTATTNPFVAIIDAGLATEEKVLVGARTGTACSSVTRGYDDTTAVAHGSGATVQHGLDASTVDQVNRLANLMAAKGAVIGHNGTNPTAVAPTAQLDDGEDGYALLVKNAEGTGLEFGRPIALVDAAAAPSVTGVPRLWFDQNTGIIRSSDGTVWKIPATLPYFASTAARDAFFGATPTQTGVSCVVGTGTGGVVQHWDGTKWIYEGVPRFANTTARDAYYTVPVTGDLAFQNDTDQLTQYRDTEWILINQKITISEVAPTGAKDGDVWLQPTS